MQNFLLFQYSQTRIFQSLRLLNSKPETYYDILNLRNDCTAKEVREAFVGLSKRFHPDVSGAASNPQKTAHFIKIAEAYQTLSKPNLRSAYDQDLLFRGRQNTRTVSHNSHASGGGFKTTEFHRPWEVHPDYDSNPGPYYGLKGINRVSNSYIAWALLTIGIFSAAIGFLSVRRAFTYHQEKLDEKSNIALQHHASVRADAHRFGNEIQLQKMINRIQRSAEE